MRSEVKIKCLFSANGATTVVLNRVGGHGSLPASDPLPIQEQFVVVERTEGEIRQFTLGK